MSDNIFLKPAEYYQRRINPLAQYVDQSGFYLSKMTGKDLQSCREFIIQGIKSKQFESMRDPVVSYFERDDNFDRHKTQTSLTNYINSVVKNKEILAPTMTTYIPPEIRRSILVEFIDNNVKVRSKAKKEAFIAKAEGRMDDYIMKNNEQDNRKRYNNSMSGTFAAGGSILNNPTAHSTLTTITRTESSLGNASNEKIISGNRHYRTPDVTLANIISITSTLDREDLQNIIVKYDLTIPTVQDVLGCIRYSSDLYWSDVKAFEKIEAFVSKLDPVERAGFVYIGDLYHLRLFNQGFVREFISKLSMKVQSDAIPDALNSIKKIDEQIVNFAHIICMDEVRGIGKDYTKISEEALSTLYATCQNIIKTITDHHDLISAVFLTPNIPSSTAYIPHMVRRSVVLSDTDSTMFSIDEWVNWYYGSVVFTSEAIAVAGAVMFIATECIAHTLAIFSANMGVERDKLFMIKMKNEFFFPVFIQSSVAKHYFASISVKEGNVYKQTETEIKGVHLKSSAAPPSLVKDSHEKMKEILSRIQSGEKISILDELKRLSDIENKIKLSLLNGAVEFYKQSKIKTADAYALGPEQSPFLHHMLWCEVFAPKYGAVEQPTYGVIKIPTTLYNPSSLKNWILTIADSEFKERMVSWLSQCKKTVLPTFYISQQYVRSNGIPVEIKSVIDIKKITLDLTKTDRMILESLGYYIKTDRLISELGY